jgi:hypothetical protein
MGSNGLASRFRRVCRACWFALSPARTMIWAIPVIAAGLLLGGCHCGRKPENGAAQSPAGIEEPVESPATEPVEKPKPLAGFPPKPGEEISLFDGQTLGQWKVTDFGGQGNVYVKDEAIYLEMGSYATGITWAGPVVRMNYEITLDAMRVQGSDFFCGLTFPVGENPCTLVLGGWGGSLCGLSSIDHFDASENETTRMIRFENGTWHHVRLRVVPDRIQVWLDDEDLVDVDITGRKIGIRLEMDLCQPLGIATWVTTGAVRNIRLKKLPDEAQ